MPMFVPLAVPVVGTLLTGGSVLAEAAASGTFDPWSLVGTTVTPVVVLILLVTGYLHTGGDYKRMEADLKETREELTALRTSVMDRAIPALTRTTSVLEGLSPLIETRLRSPNGG